MNTGEAEQFKSDMNRMALLAGLAYRVDLTLVRDVHGRAEALGPLIFPTEYLRGGMANLENQGILIRAFEEFQEALKPMDASLRLIVPAEEDL